METIKVLLMGLLITNGQFMTTFSSSCRYNFTAICCGHTRTKTVFVTALTITGLIRSFHDYTKSILKQNGKVKYFA